MKTLCLILVVVLTNVASGQDVKVDVKIEYVGWTGYKGDESYGIRIRLYKDQPYKDEWPNLLRTAVDRDPCYKHFNAGTSGEIFPDVVFTTTVPLDNPKLKLYFVSHEERKVGSDDCTSQGATTGKSDLFQKEDVYEFDLSTIAPGVYSDLHIFKNENGGSTVIGTVRIRYTPPPPAAPVVSPSASVCANGRVTLSTSTSLNKSGLRYEWQYNDGTLTQNPSISDCYWNCETEITCSTEECKTNLANCLAFCDATFPPVLFWQDFRPSSGETETFPLNGTFDYLTSTTNIRFRVRAVSNDLSSDFSEASNVVSMLPAPPKSSKSILTEASCLAPTGKVILNEISSPSPTYRYILKKGDTDVLDCDPEKGECLLDGQPSGQNTGSKLTINNVPAGQYSLFLLLDGGSQGVCPGKVGSTFNVDPVTALRVADFNPVNLSCHDVNEGSIAVTIFDGRPTNVTYDLLNQTTGAPYTKTSSTAGATVAFNGLGAGAYKLTVDDGCTAPVSRTFNITRPVKVDLTEFQNEAASCITPGNGTAKINVQRIEDPFTISSSPILQYQLFKNDVLLDYNEGIEKEFTWLKKLSPDDSYKIVAKEKGSLDCNGYTQNFSIASPPALRIASLTTGDAKCFNGGDGSILVTGAGGSGAYAYQVELLNAPVDSNVTGEFKNLKSGDYIIIVKNNFACNDEYRSSPVPIKQPDELIAQVYKQDISCYGVADGELTSAVAGRPAESDYIYSWETSINSAWISMSVFSATVKGQQEGSYRLRIADANNPACVSFSNEVSIVEPEALRIEDVVVNDIKCIAEKGTIEIIPSGGTTPYSFEYSKDQNPFIAFNNTTPLNEGSYRIKIKDKNNCAADDLKNYQITAPPAAISFSTTLSDFNGFNISCFGGSNGSVTATPQGGNGSGYMGYTYAVDSRTFQENPKLENINAGTRSIKIKDGRGCVVVKDIAFTQTAQKLVSTLIEKKNVKCLGDETGIFEVSGSGGLLPFKYSLNGGDSLAIGRFTNLGVGDYTITLIDKNNCSANFTETITPINTPIVIQLQPTDVNCFEGSDGTITANVSDGVPPFQYQWEGLPNTSAKVSGLRKGVYSVTVTDAPGCQMKAQVSVNQPGKAVNASIYVVPVCFGRTDGKITFSPTGGTAPYLFSKDDGLTYQSDPLFLVGVGDYALKTKDVNGCVTTATAKVIQRNDKPEPNFLAATKRNALDTLVITEISIPKPDSVFWIFDAKATVVNNNQWAPQIKFNEAGTYTVSMTGFFAGCDYSITKNLYLNPYDPTVQPEKKPGYTPIQSVSVTPNPSSGEFEVTVVLDKKRNLSMIIYDMIGVTHYTNNWESIAEVKQKITLDNISSGIYLVRVITETDAKDVRLVISK